MISVIIATRDRAQLLATTLESLAHQEWPGEAYEILVVDNASLDSTPQTVTEAAGRSAAPVLYLREPRAGKSHALNTAAAHATGDLLALTDDDVLPSRGWLAAYAKAFRESGADYAVGRILPLWEAPPPPWLSPELYGVLAVPDGGTERLRLAQGQNDEIMPLGANMAIRRYVVDRVGGWNPDLGKLQGTLRTGEDHEFALKMRDAGYAGVYEPDAVVQHRVPAERLRLQYFRRWFYENGAIEARLERDFPSTHRYLAGIPRHLWRQLAHDLVLAGCGLLTGNLARATAPRMRLVWFAGYAQNRWSPVDTPPGGQGQSAAASRS